MDSEKFPSGEKLSEQFIRYAKTGIVTFFIGMGQFKILYLVIPKIEFHNTYIWILNFTIGTLWLHALHRKFTFKYIKCRSYFSSLLRTYLSYGSALVIGSFMMLIFCDVGNMHHLLGWAITNTTMSIFNYYIMRTFAMVSVD